jgi:hypothetical protein
LVARAVVDAGRVVCAFGAEVIVSGRSRVAATIGSSVISPAQNS